jgi:hypothetical protein
MLEFMVMCKRVIATRLPGIVKEFGSDNGVLWVDRPEDALGKALRARCCYHLAQESEKERKPG